VNLNAARGVIATESTLDCAAKMATGRSSIVLSAGLTSLRE
jgi:hypothetical protein